MKFLVFKGNNFSVGYDIGKKFSKIIKTRVKLFSISDSFVRKRRKELEKTDKICRNTFPEFVKELEAISAGSCIDYWKILSLNSLEIIDPGRCSSIAIKKNNEIIIAHNEDADSFENKKDFAIVKILFKNTTFHSFIYPGELLGSAYWWNSYGMIISINNLRIKQNKLSKFPKTFIARALIETKSIEEAFSILKKYPCASGYHYFLAKDNELLSIEQYHNKLSLLDINRIYPHTNHFLHDMFKTIIPTGNSKIRLNRMKEMLEQKQDYLDILFDKKNRPNSIFNRKNDYNRTISTFVAEPLKNRIRIYTRDSRKSFIEFKIN